MAAPNTSSAAQVESSGGGDDGGSSSSELTAKTLRKRYEGLVMVRTKAIKGKGAWYWAHLEPILVPNSETGLPKAVKLRCSLCDAVFSASNPSRTASEHLKRGTCPNFNSTVAKPSSGGPPPSTAAATTAVTVTPSSSASSHHHHNHRKRNSSGTGRAASGGGGGSTTTPFQPPPLAIIDPSRFSVGSTTAAAASVSTSGGGGCGGDGTISTTPYQPPPLAIIDPSRFSVGSTTAAAAACGGGGGGAIFPHQQLILSGGKEDLGALAMFEDSVKKLKSPKTSPGPTLSRSQVEAALDFLADWVYECCGSVSFSNLEHPKFKEFLNRVGLPSISRKEFAGSRLDAKYEVAKAESEVKIRDAMFFQIAADGWKAKNPGGHIGEENLVNLSVNLPNGTSVFRRAVLTSGYVPSKYAEDVLWDTISEICGQNVHQCVGIVGDKFKGKALRNLENQHCWMVNISCQYQAFNSLIKDFGKELPLFKNTTENSIKLANFINNKSQIRNSFHKYQLQEYGHAGLLRVPERLDFGPVYTLVEDILSSARALHLVLMDESYKVVMDEPNARGIEEMMRNPQFWNELEAVHSLVKLVKAMVMDIETDKPRVGQCLPLWEELRVKMKDWCCKFQIPEGPVEKLIERRFNKNYHPAWAAAFILDPLYLIKDASGKYLPPFKYLTPEQEKDVDKLITRLVSREEAHIALMELMKWRTEGLDPVYAQAVQLKQRDPNTGKMKIANPQSSRLVWETYLTEFKALGKVAVRLIFLHATSCGFKCNSSFLRWVGAQSHSRVGVDRAQKLIFIAAHSKLEKRDFSNEEDKDAELFAMANG